MKRKSALVVASIILLFSFFCSAQEQNFASVGDLKLVSGESIKDCRIGYRTFGQLNADKSNVIVFPYMVRWENLGIGRSNWTRQDR